MRRFRIALGSLAVAAAATLGCDTAPPGGGITNGPAPDTSSEKPAIRTDGPDRDRTDQGELKGAGGLAGMPDGGGAKDSGTGGKGGNSGEGPPAKATSPTSAPVAKGATGPNSAAGATKPAGDIKVGTPKSPE